MLVQTQAPANAAFETLTGIDLPLNLAVALASPIGGWMVGGMFSRQRRGITSAQMRAHEGSLQQKLREDNQQEDNQQEDNRQGSSLYERTQTHLAPWLLAQNTQFPRSERVGFVQRRNCVCARRTPAAGSSGEPLPWFSRNSVPSTVWVAIIEKAYAKLKGSYGAIDLGHAREAMVDLSGGVMTERLRV